MQFLIDTSMGVIMVCCIGAIVLLSLVGRAARSVRVLFRRGDAETTSAMPPPARRPASRPREMVP